MAKIFIKKIFSLIDEIKVSISATPIHNSAVIVSNKFHRIRIKIRIIIFLTIRENIILKRLHKYLHSKYNTEDIEQMYTF